MLTVNKNLAITKLNRLIEDGRQNAGAVIELTDLRPVFWILVVQYARSATLHSSVTFRRVRARIAQVRYARYP